MSEFVKARLAEHKARQILYINPKCGVSESPVDDELVEIMEKAYAQGTAGRSMRGYHECVCGERSRNYDVLLPGGHVTNSLCVHYLRYHRDEVPEEEIEKVRALGGGQCLCGTTQNPIRQLYA